MPWCCFEEGEGEGEGVMRGWGPGMAACRRRVSMRVAWRRGRASRDCGVGRLGFGGVVVVVVVVGVVVGCGGCVGGLKCRVGERVRSSARSRDCRSGCRESSWKR